MDFQKSVGTLTNTGYEVKAVLKGTNTQHSGNMGQKVAN